MYANHFELFIDMPLHSDGKAHVGSSLSIGSIGEEVIATVKLFRTTVYNKKITGLTL
jgi:hypothetical protein